MPESHPYHPIWTGSLHLGDTFGVFTDAEFAGLLLQIPIKITSTPKSGDPVQLLLLTTEVEIFNEKKHFVYWDWEAGNPLSPPVGFIDNTAAITDRPEYHVLSIPSSAAPEGNHWITIIVNPEVPAGLRDDFILKRIEAHETVGAKVGW